MSGISIIIPNYNGHEILKKHLPAVLAAARSGDELVIIDDCSTDQSWKWLTTHFATRPNTQSTFGGEVEAGTWSVHKKNGAVQLLRNSTNRRFAQSCNRAVEQATQPLVFLINSDVSPHPDSISHLVEHFTDNTVFAVGCLEHEHGDDTQPSATGGKNVLAFKRGMFTHRRADDFTTGETAWASGGSGMFDRQKWLELGGFDPAYYPAYWEDVDLSFRAKRRGWKVLFDQAAEVDHNHESTNVSAFGQKKMKLMSWQHSHTFLHKHGTFWQRVQYFLWQPYWWIKFPYYSVQQLQIMFFLAMIVLAIGTRGYQLGTVPHGLAWDEAAIGYNGFSVATTGRDETLKILPISFRSFGDYKAPLAIYINGIFTLFLGITPFSIRLPFMISSIFAIVGMIGLTYVLWSEWSSSKEKNLDLAQPFPSLTAMTAALLAGGLLTTSSWHIHYSRVGFESGMAMTFVIWGVLALVVLLWRKLQAQLWQRICLAVFAAGSLAASLYTYHSSKIVAPLLLIVVGITYRRKLLRHIPAVLGWGIFLAVLLLPLGYDSFFGPGGSRFTQTSIFKEGVPAVEVAQKFTRNFGSHFDPKYLIGGYTPNLRHGDGSWGVLYITELVLCLAAVSGVITYSLTKNPKFKLPSGLIFFALSWIVIGILPGAIGSDAPHSNRTLLALPGFIVLAVLGWQSIAQFATKKLWAPALLGTLLLIHFLLFSSYIHHYFTVFAKESAADFSDGYLEAMRYVATHENEVDQVIVTTAYQQPTIYTLIARKTDVYSYNYGGLIKYDFREKLSEADLLRPRTLFVATPEQMDYHKAEYVVFGSDNKMRFVIIRTQ